MANPIYNKDEDRKNTWTDATAGYDETDDHLVILGKTCDGTLGDTLYA